MENHVQCLLRKFVALEPVDGIFGRYKFQVAWLPKDKAKPGESVDLKNRETGEWDKGWTVERISDVSLPSTWVAERSADYRNMRKMTDI